MSPNTHRNEAPSDWYELPTDNWRSILGYCDYTTSTHIAVAFAFSSKYGKILPLLDPVDISDLLLLTNKSTKSVKNQTKVLATSVRLKSATLTSALSLSAEWLLRIPAMIQLSENSLENLSCYLEDFSVLPRFPRLNRLQLLCSERKEKEEGVNFHCDLRPEQAAFLGQLPVLQRLNFIGFTTIDLSSIKMPQLKELNINFQAIRGTLDTQNRLTFALPKDCLLDQLTIQGPEDQISDTEEEGTFSMTTNIDLKSVLNHCKSIDISGSNIVFDINTNSDLDHASAAAECIVKAKTWDCLQIDLIKYLKDLNIDLPELCVYHGDQGTENIAMIGLDGAIAAAARAGGQNIIYDINDDFIPFDEGDFDDGSEEEDPPYKHGILYPSDSGTENGTEEDEQFQNKNKNENKNSSSHHHGALITTTMVIRRS